MPPGRLVIIVGCILGPEERKLKGKGMLLVSPGDKQILVENNTALVLKYKRMD